MATLLNKLKIRLTRLTHYEYWPFWVFYAPVYPYGIWLALRTRSFSYFTATNPGIMNGGAFGCSKFNVLRQLNTAHLPKTAFFPAGTTENEILAALSRQEISFPFIVKPDMGERGKAVEKINSEQDLLKYLQQNETDILIQDFIDHELEFGILYYKVPGEESGNITSIVSKEFLTMVGDGHSTLEKLIDEHPRTQKRLTYLKEKYQKELSHVLNQGEAQLLEPIGNHSRGTTFLNANHLINEQLVNVFDKIAKPIDGFYYGRFDLKVPTLEDLYAGNHIKIMEVNGVNAEPAHIYDPNGKLLPAYKDVVKHMNIIHLISSKNHSNGNAFRPISLVLKDLFKNISPQQKRPIDTPSQETFWT